MLSMAILELTMILGVQDARLPESGPSWTTADVAIIIEGVQMTDEGRQTIVTQLVEDFSSQWEHQLSQYQQQLDQASGRHTPDYIAASDALGRGMQASRSAHAKLKELRHELAKARPNRAFELHHEIQEASTRADELMQDVRAAQQTVRTSAHPSFKDIIAATELFNTQLELRRNQLERDIRMLLLVQEFSDWTRVTTMVDRRRRLQQGTLQGEHLNLDTVVNRINPPLTPNDRERLETALLAWGVDVDAALDARSLYDLVTNVQIAAFLESGRGIEALDLAMARQAAGQLVRDTTLRHVETLCGVLDTTTAARLKHDCLESAFPALHRTSSFERAIKICITRDDAHRDELTTLLAEYRYHVSAARANAITQILRTDGGSYLQAIASSAGIESNGVAEDRHTNTGIAEQQAVSKDFFQRLQKIVGKAAAANAMKRR
jgi:hypothetical protein